MVRIRSQDGKIFMDAGMLSVDDGDLWACGVGQDVGLIVGNFPTQEQAIAELDKIQKLVHERQPNPIYQITKP